MKNNKKVISKNTKGNKSNKDNILNKFMKFISNHKKLSIGFGILLLIIIIVILFIKNMSINYKVVTINNNDYYKNDFMIYLYSAKYNYFGKKDVSDDDLNVVIDEESKMTVREYLKEIALSDLKTASAIKEMANDNNIFLNNKDLEELKSDKKEFIKSLGGNKSFKEFLKNNNTTEESYDNMAESDKLYQKIIKKLYSEGAVNDLDEEELNNANNTYGVNYYKIKQIILTTIDITTGKNLSSTTINQKETLANSIVQEANSGIEFDKLIKKYSEDAVDKEPPYYVYYKKGELLSELENVVQELKPGQISKPIKTKYAYHIIQKLELDDYKLYDYYDDLRKEKCIDDLKDYLDDLKVIYHDAYEKIEVK